MLEIGQRAGDPQHWYLDCGMNGCQPNCQGEQLLYYHHYHQLHNKMSMERVLTTYILRLFGIDQVSMDQPG